MQGLVTHPQLRVGDVFVELTHGFFGLGVELLAQQHYQHVKAVRPDLISIIEDGDRGVTIKPLDTDWSNFEVWRPKADEATCLAVNAKLETRLGEWYSVPELTAEWLRKKFRMVVPNMPGADCSEFLSWGWEQAGYPLFTTAPYTIAPWDFRNTQTLERIW